VSSELRLPPIFGGVRNVDEEWAGPDVNGDGTDSAPAGKLSRHAGVRRGLAVTYLRSFAPWILYAALSSVDWRIGVCVAAVAAGVLAVDQRRKHDLDLLTGVTFVFFVVMAVIALVSPHSGLHRYTPALSAATLAVIAFGSLAFKQPFTLSIARRTTPEQFWHTPLFLHINTVITTVWACSFATSAVVSSLVIHADLNSSVPLIVVQVAGFGVPAVFTRRYTEQQRAAARPDATA
jgi:hypothetical protein